MNCNVIINPWIFRCLIYGSVAFAGGLTPVTVGRGFTRDNKINRRQDTFTNVRELKLRRIMDMFT